MKTLSSTPSSNGMESNGSKSNATTWSEIESGDGLIVCDTQLASSFREVNCCKSKVKPGHYLQKALLGKFKSQSDPSLGNEPPSNEEGVVDLVDSNNVTDGSKDEWFKTWPDCVDKEKLRDGIKEDSAHAESNPNTPLPLKDVQLPLAYSPITKQLHLIDSALVKPKEKVSCCEVPSIGSNVSSLSDASSSNVGDNGDLASIGNCSLASEDEGNDIPKKKGLSGLLFRGVFNWKLRDQERWSLFSRSSTSSEDRGSLGSDHGIVGSTGLIQLERPAGLPAKSLSEHLAHIDQHDKILSSNRKRDTKEIKLREKLMQLQLKAEEETAHATRIWNQEILPKWVTIRNHKRTLELWWQGIPPCIRGKIWRLAIVNDLNLTYDLYYICLSRAVDRLKNNACSSESMDELNTEFPIDRVHTMKLIQLDISRTFPHLCIFQKKGPYYEMLHNILAAYVCYRPDVGYVQGMSFIAAVLILNMDEPDAFVCFANLLNRKLHRAFFSLDQQLMHAYYATYCGLIKENLPNVHKHFEESDLTPDLYLLDWVYTIFAKATHLDIASRLWDVFVRDGEEFIFKAAIGVLKMFEQELLTMDFLTGSKFLTRLPDDLSTTKLFKNISQVKMSNGKTNFHQLFEKNLKNDC